MKTIILTTVFAMSIISCNIKSDFDFRTKEGKGPITKKEYKMDFDGIKVAQSISAEVFKANEEKVVISAPSDIMDDILVENAGGKLYIHFKPGINISANNVTAKIYAKDFSSIEASSSADINVRDKFTQEKTDVKVSSSASIKGNFEANDLSIDASSSGDFSGQVWAVNLKSSVNSSAEIMIKGKTKNANFDASSSGTLDAKNVIAENADIQSSSSSDVNLSVTNQLNSLASSSGSINIWKKGNLDVMSQKESSGGSISIQ